MNYQENFPRENITELNDLIYAGTKLVNDKKRKLNRNAKLRQEMKLEGQIKKLWQQDRNT